MIRLLRLLGIALLLLAFAVEAAVLRLCIWRPLRLQALRARRLRWWLRQFANIIGLQVSQYGGFHGGASLLVANHISWLDIVALGSVMPLRFVAKQEVRAWPVLGLLVAAAGTLFIQRGSARQAGRVLDEMTWWLLGGGCVVVFPEGTSTDGQQVRRFHARLFNAATRTRVPVQPVAIRYEGEAARVAPFVGNDDFLGHLWQLLGMPSIHVTLWAALPFAGVDRSSHDLAADAQREVSGFIEGFGRIHDTVTIGS